MDTIEAIKQFVSSPPEGMTQRHAHGWMEWTEAGEAKMAEMMEAHAAAHPDQPHVMARKMHGYEFEPNMNVDSIYASDDDRCEGGCCDERW